MSCIKHDKGGHWLEYNRAPPASCKKSKNYKNPVIVIGYAKFGGKNNIFEIHMDEICTKFKVNSYSFLRISPPGKIQIQYVTKNRLLTPIF